jgi:ATP-binding cassette subfamily C (CFTR/MRP) protein 1
MIDGSAQRVIINEPGLRGSFRTAQAQFSTSRQAFCGDREGWGPLSPVRFDFTPCFLDVWVLLVAAWGLLMGAGAIWFLLKKRIAQPVPKNWHFYAKLVSAIPTCTL